MDKLLKGKVAVVTGGTRGIGYAIVKKYVEAGAVTILCGSREETATKALDKIKTECPEAKVEAIWPNLSDRAEVTQAFRSIKEKYGSLDILANNAGISRTPLCSITKTRILIRFWTSISRLYTPAAGLPQR